VTDYVDTVIVGGGQAGLAVSYYLSQQGRAHVVLEPICEGEVKSLEQELTQG